MPAPILEFNDVSFSYDASPVVADVTLSVDEHDFVCVVGPNGGGKTTLLKLVLGVVQPTRGRVTVFGGPPERARPARRLRPPAVAVRPPVPRAGDGRGPDGPARPPAWFGFYHRPDKEAAAKALGQVNLAELSHRPFAALWAASASAFSSPARSPPSPTCSSSTSRPPASTSRSRKRSTPSFGISIGASPSSSSPTTSGSSRPSSRGSSA